MEAATLLKVGSTCNNKCIFCAALECKAAHDKNLKDIARELVSLPRKDGDITIVLPCNSDMRKDFLQIVDLLHKEEVRFIIQTSAQVCDDRLFCSELAQHKVTDIMVILFGLDKKDYDTATGNPGSFERATQGIRHLVDAESFNLEFTLIHESHEDIVKTPLSRRLVLDMIDNFNRRPNVFLINPSYQPHWSKNRPTGVLYLASVLEDNGYNVTFFDFNVTEYQSRILTKAIDTKKPIAIGLSCHVRNCLQAYVIGNDIKRYNPNVKLVYGGVHPTTLPMEPFEKGSADFVCINEAEFTMLELMNNLDRRENYSTIEGLAYRGPDEIKLNKPRQFVEDLDKMPFPAYYLASFDQYAPEFHILSHLAEPSISFMASRGCPFDCIFCATPYLSGRTIRFRSSKNIVEEIEWLQKYFHINNIHFHDDNFLFDHNRILELCNTIRKRKIRINWVATSKVDAIVKHPEILPAMRAAGCLGIEIGVESGEQAVLDCLHKDFTLAEIRKANILLKENGIYPMYLMMCYCPGENIDSPYLKAKFYYELLQGKEVVEIPVEASAAYHPSMHSNLMRVSPGCSLYKNVSQYGYLFAKDWSEHYQETIRFLPHTFLNDTPVKLKTWKKEEVLSYLERYRNNIRRYVSQFFYCSKDVLDEASLNIDSFFTFMAETYDLIDGALTVNQLYASFCDKRDVKLSIFAAALSYLSIFRLIASRKSC